jgi:hypothetical protein
VSRPPKQPIHFAAFGYEPGRMKPIHLATGYFLAITGRFFRLEWLNKAAVISHKDGLKDDYVTATLLDALRADHRLGDRIDGAKLNTIRGHLNAVMDNDAAVFAAYAPYSTFGNDYTLSSARFVTSHKRLDGYAGYFLSRVLSRTETGQAIIDFSRRWIEEAADPVERFTEPLLDLPETAHDWVNQFESKFGNFDDTRLDQIAARMASQTGACRLLCQNLDLSTPHPARLRFLIIALGMWLLTYLVAEAADASDESGGSILFMDFLGKTRSRCRAQSCASFARHRELIYRAYPAWKDAGRFADLDAHYGEFKNDFKILEQHFSDLAVRIGLAQPRAAQAKRKHYELQPDTCRTLLTSVMEAGELADLPTISKRLKETWGACIGAGVDDRADLHAAGYLGLDDDDDLRPNRAAFVRLLKTLDLAFEPSDGLVLCALDNDLFS